MYADPYKISQVVRNLLSNALKFTRERGTVRIIVSLENSSAELGATANGGADIEAGTSTQTAAALGKALRRYVRRQSEVYAESTHLVISVEDSGAGISTVCMYVYMCLCLTHKNPLPCDRRIRPSCSREWCSSTPVCCRRDRARD